MPSINVASTRGVIQELSQPDTDMPVTPKKTAKRKPEEDSEIEKENDEPEFKRRRPDVATARLPVPTFVAPVPWTVDAGAEGKAMLVDDTSCVIGTCDGRVIEFDHDGKEIRQFYLQPKIGAILREEDSLYAWCYPNEGYLRYKGTLYDITGDNRRVLYHLEHFGDKVLHAALVQGCLAVSDDRGSVALLGCGGKIIWSVKQPELQRGRGCRFFAADNSGVYVAIEKTVYRYDLKTGEQLWSYEAPCKRHTSIESGTMDADCVYLDVDNSVVRVSKVSGDQTATFVLSRHRAGGVCVGAGLLLTGSCPTVLFDLTTTKECCQMQLSCRLSDAVALLHQSRKFFVFWDKLYCVDLTTNSIDRAVEGRSTRTMERPLTRPEHTPLEGVLTPEGAESGGGVIVKCTQVDGVVVARATAAVRYRADWEVCLPHELKIAGRRYIVQKLVESEIGEFYRAAGTIKILNGAMTEGAVGTPSGTVTIQPGPTSDDQPGPTGDDQPSPTDDDQPSPTGDDQPNPTSDDQPSPTGDDQPSPTSDNQPGPTNDQPNQASDDQPCPTSDQPSQASDDQPGPTSDQPSPASDDQPSQTCGDQRVPTSDDQPGPANDDLPSDQCGSTSDNQ